MSEKIIEKQSYKSYEEDMVKYSIIVNRRRAFPEIKDGLKVVQRRTIYDMMLKNVTDRNKTKASSITGDTIGRWHPHGDSSVYTCMQSLGLPFKCKAPLVAIRGNWGTIMGDGAAAQRYTEAGLSDFCLDAVIGELRDTKGIVDWVENYKRDEMEPEYLPVKVPILLINGSFGIGVGMAVNIPPHNIAEVIAETRAVIRDPNHRVFLIPDHCQPCELLDTDWREICETGRGSYKQRGIVQITEEKGYPTIHVRSLPDNVYTNMITDVMEKLIVEKQLPMIRDIDDQSQNGIVDIIIVLKKGADPNYVREVLYSKTKVQSTVSVNFEAVDGVDPRRYNYTDYIRTFLENRAMCKFRWYCNKLKVNMTRYHQLIAYIKIIESGEIDNIIKMVKKQQTTDDTELMEYLIKRLEITDLQAKFILATDIRKLTKGHLKKYKEEFAILEKEQKVYRAAITDDGTIIRNEIDRELVEIAKKYSTPRLCRVIQGSGDSIPKGIFKVVITEHNYIRKLPDSDKVGIVRKDNPKFVIKTDNAENILLFDNKGRVFKLPVHKIPVTDRNNPGVDIRMLIKNLTSDIIAVYYEPDIKHIVAGRRKHYLTMVSRDNLIKKMELEDFLNVNVSGLIYTKMRDEDAIVGLVIAPANLDIVIYSKQRALRTPLASIPLFKRNASGSKAMNTDTALEGISIMYPDVQSIVVVTERGRLNKFPVSGLSQKNRAKGGNNVIKLEPGDSIFSISGVNETDRLYITTSDTPIEIPVAMIKTRSTIAAGDKIPIKTATILRCDIIHQ